MSSLLSSVNCCSFATDWFGEVLKQCEPQCSCGCCSALRPRYKRLVDNIFPSNPQDGLVKSNMEKLTFYSLSSPEKLDRIGEYLARKVARDLSRHRNGYVVIAMDAMDQLLVSCHAQTLNLFVESFLKVVQQLLESQEPHMQLLATQSFVKFTNIEEDTPSYHRRYDFFVSKFSSLCHNGNMDLEVRNVLRLAGLNGLKGVIRKTVGDDLQANIFDETHMGKIVPSLLFNMQCQDVIGITTSDSSHASSENPGAIAEECLRELIGRAAFGHVHNVVKPMLKHLDNHQLWNARHPCNFAQHSFTIIMYSIQAQHSYAVIRLLMSHLDDNARDDTDNSDYKIQVKTGIVNVLSAIVAISATESIGPGVLEMINSLLNHLRTSINNCQNVEHVELETRFQETVINTLGEFANNLPDFQKIEILIFIISKAPPLTASSSTDKQLQHIILKSLLKVTTKYNTVNMAQAFPSALLNPLLSRALSLDPEVRLIVQRIFHQLLDRHNNLAKLAKPASVAAPDQLTIEKASRQDMLFMRKHISEISLHIYENIQFTSNTLENFHSIYVTLALLCVEFNSEETLAELLRLTFAMQEVALLKTLGLPETITVAIHGLVAGFCNLIAHLTAIPALCAHIETVIKSRSERCARLLPERCDAISDQKTLKRRSMSSIDELSDELLFSKTAICEALHSSGHDTNKLLTPFMSRNVVDSSLTRSISDLNTITVEVDSVNSSPTVYRRAINEEITYESLRKILTKPSSAMQEEVEMRRAVIIERFRSSRFEDLVARYEKKTNNGVLQQKLAEVFNRLSDQCSTQSADVIVSEASDNEWRIRDNPLNPFGDLIRCNITVNSIGPPLFALKFPDLFVY